VESSLALKLMFVVLPIALVCAAAAMVKSAKFLVCGISILILTAALALSGILADFESLPPRLLLMLGPLTIVTVVSAFSSIGKRFSELPLMWLVGFQAFRFPLELMIYQAVSEGVAPPQFTWTGMNYDVIVGVASLVMFPFVKKLPAWAIWCWSVLGIGLLINVVTVAIISTPGPLKILSPDNTWVAWFPFVWLPTICVMAALFGHLVTIRKILTESKTTEAHQDSSG